LEQNCGGPHPSLSHPHPHLPSIQTPQGANISKDKWKWQKNCLEVNIYPLHPKRPLIYAMSVIQLTQGTLDAMYKCRCAFLWSGEGRVHGSQVAMPAHLGECLSCILEKEQSGLGIRDIAAKTKCLLLKLLHRLLSHPEISNFRM
jgi:hypothetical protein